MKKVDVIREEVIKQRKEEDTSNGLEPDKDTYDEVVNKFKLNRNKSYDFLIESFEEYTYVIFLMCRRFLQNKIFPDKFKKQLPTKFERESRDVVKGMDKKIKAATNKFQIGVVAGHRPQEYIFSILFQIGTFVAFLT